MRNRASNKILSFALAAVMLFTLLPGVTVYSENSGGLGASSVITAFDALPEGVASQTVSLGTSMSALTLSDKLVATVDGAPGSVPVDEWQSEPEYDGDTEGVYIFSPELPGEYTVEDGVEPPVITVTVEPVAPAVTITIAEDESDSTALYLIEGVAVTEDDLLAGVSAEDENGNPVEVTVQSVDGLDMQNPIPRGAYPNPPYVITYAAAHPADAGVTATTTREVYVTLGAADIMPMNLNTDLDAGTWTDGHRWVEFGGILWRVLEVKDNDSEASGNKTALLLAENSVGNRQFHTTFNAGDNDWSSSDIKAWLNNEECAKNNNDYTTSGFLSRFISDEQDAIVTSNYIYGGSNTGYGTSASSKVFLLSYDDVTNPEYFGNDDSIGENTDRAISASWWLRSPGGIDFDAAFVAAYGIVSAIGYPVDGDYAIRPALKVNLASAIFASKNPLYEATITVEDGLGGKIAGARISFSDASAPDAKFSNSAGVATFLLPNDIYNLTVTKLGYADQTSSITVNENGGQQTITLTAGGDMFETVYFGQYGGNEILWRVLEVIDNDSDNSGNKTALLLADGSVTSRRFDNNSSGNWVSSEIKTWLNGSDSGDFLEQFSPSETGAVVTASYKLGGDYTYGGYGKDTAASSQMFLLSVEEANNPAYFADNAMRSITGGLWWLRSPGESANSAAVVRDDGRVRAGGSPVGAGSVAIRPAFKLNLSSVIFISAASDGKSDTVGTLSAAEPTTGAGKLTVVDSGQMLEDVVLTGGAGSNMLTFSYNNSTATPGANQYISCVLVDNDSGEVKNYGKLKDLTSGRGDGSVSVPLSDVDDGTYTLKIFSEQANGDNLTDFCSTPVEMMLDVTGGNGEIESVLDGASITLAAPVYGANSTEASVSAAGYSHMSTSWTVTASSAPLTTGDPFAGSTAYTATIRLTSNTGYKFAGTVQTSAITMSDGGTVQSATTNGSNSGNTLTVVVNYPATVLDAPTSFTDTPGNGQVALSWTAPASDGGNTITKYQYSASTGADNWQDIPGSDSSTTSYTVTGLTNGTTYTFKVRAVNSAGNGTEASTTATPATVPDAPTSLTAAPGNGQVALSWTAPADNGGSVITKYQYSASTGADNWQDISGSDPSTTSYTVTGLTNGTTYTFKVRAVNAVDAGTEATETETPTAPATMTSITVKTQPAKMTYTDGESLDLASLEVTLAYSDASTQDVGYTDFGTHGISMSYTGGGAAAHGDTLTVAAHNGKTITLTIGSLTTTTNALTVSAALTYTAAVDPASHTFMAVTEGYGQQSAQQFTVTNTGTSQLTNVTAVLGGTNFEISAALSSSIINANGSVTVSVRPVTGLSANTYTDALTIRGDNGLNLTVDLSFTVNDKTDAQTPTITAQPQGATVYRNGSVNLSVTASVTGGGILSYQWYRNTLSANTGGMAISGATNSTYSPPTSSTGTTYYYVVVTNTNNNATGGKTASVNSNAVAVTVYTSGGSSSGGSGGSDSYTAPAYTYGTITVNGVNVSYSIQNSTGIMTLNLTDRLLDKILAAAGENKTIALNAGSPANLKGLEISFPPAWFGAHTDITIAVQSGIGGINLNNNLAKKFPAQDTTATVSVKKGSLILSARQSGKTVTWNTAGETVVIYMPYTPAANTDANAIVLYNKANGAVVAHSYYSGGKVYGAVNKTGEYDVKVNAVSYTDTASHWAKTDIGFVTSRGLISGATSTTFAPDTAITRADFITALGKLSGADVSQDAWSSSAGTARPDGYKQSSFTDVSNSSAAMPYIEWAVANDIVSGTGGGKFSPDAAITREQMAVMMVNYGAATGQALSATQQAVTFADDAKISSWAKEAVKAVQKANIITGKPGNLFDPQGSATRAEASSILRRFAENTASGAKS